MSPANISLPATELETVIAKQTIPTQCYCLSEEEYSKFVLPFCGRQLQREHYHV